MIETPAGRWVQPPGWIGWIPRRLAHGAHSHGAAEGWSLYLDDVPSAVLPAQPQVYAPQALVQALVDRLAGLTARDDARRQRLVAVLVDELAGIERSPMHLPMPHDQRLVRMAAALVADRSDPSTLASVGYACPSAFIERFAAQFGRTPARFIADGGAP